MKVRNLVIERPSYPDNAPLMKTYVIFGQDHVHAVNGKTFDKDCVAIINSESAEQGRKLAFEYFGEKFCFEYPEEYFDMSSMIYFPRGFIDAN